MITKQSSFFIFVFLVYTSFTGATPDTTALILDTMKVRAPKPNTPATLSISESEALIGISDDLNQLIIRPTISRVPETGTYILSQGDGPFDNGFYLNDVRILPPSHFAGNVFADRSALPVAVPAEVQLWEKGFSGKYSGSSGSVMRVSPGFVCSPRLKPRPEVMINYGTLAADLTLAVPMRKGEDHYQLSWRPSDTYNVFWNNLQYRTFVQQIGLTAPVAYSDLQFLGEQRIGGFYLRELAWLGEDSYVDFSKYQQVELNEPPSKLFRDSMQIKFPWGIFALTLCDASRPDGLRITVGIARQHSIEGKRQGWVVPKTIVNTDRASVAIIGPKLSLPYGSVSVDARCDFENWKGMLEWSYQYTTPYKDYLLWRDTTQTITTFGDSTATASISGHYQAPYPAGSFGMDLLGAVRMPKGIPYADPGLWITASTRPADLRLDLGWVTTFPDIRNLPSDTITDHASTCYNTSISADYRFPVTTFSLHNMAYAKIKKSVPVLNNDPLRPIWNEHLFGRHVAYGFGMAATAIPDSLLQLNIIGSVGRSQVETNGHWEPAPWEQPWSLLAIITSSLFDGTLRFILSGTVAAGLPYRPLNPDLGIGYDTTWKTLPTYRSIDLKTQLEQPVDKHRYLRRFAAYFTVYNILDGLSFLDSRIPRSENVRDYFWNSQMQRQTIILRPFTMEMGVRVQFRL